MRLSRWIVPLAVAALALGACQPAKKKPPPPDTCPDAPPANDIGPINFEPPTYAPGNIHNQDGWSATEANGFDYDQEVVVNSAFPGPAEDCFGSQSWRDSNFITGTSFGDQPLTPSLPNEAGETTAKNDPPPPGDPLSGGDRQPFFEAEWQFASAVPDAEQPGLALIASPNRGDESRMSWVEMRDTPGGLEVRFIEITDTTSPVDFPITTLVSGLDRAVPHTIRLTIEFVDDPSNDIVKVWVDGLLVKTGTSLENYFWFDVEAQPEAGPRTVDSILFHNRGANAPESEGKGFLIENVTLGSGPVPT
jgi:hypothetical protein